MGFTGRSLLCLALAVLALPLSAANFSGKWALTRQPSPGGGRGGSATILVLNQVGDQVTGSVSPPIGVSTGSPTYTDVLDGKVDGDTISFYLWTGLDKPVKNYYRGKLSDSEIVFTITLDAAGQTSAPPVQMTAKRVP